jgi:hypothetical protein
VTTRSDTTSTFLGELAQKVKSASYLLNFRPSVCPKVTAAVPTGWGFVLILDSFPKICQETPNLVKIAQKYMALYNNTTFILLKTERNIL